MKFTEVYLVNYFFVKIKQVLNRGVDEEGDMACKTN